MTSAAFGTRMAVPATPTPVDTSEVVYDPNQQISMVLDGGVVVPALKHSTGKTATNTAVRDYQGGPDKDSDQTED